MEQTRDDAVAALREHLAWLRRSGAAFDAGDESEAKRIAVAIRGLVHDKGSSHSILWFLGVKDDLRYVDSGDPPIEPEPGRFLWHMGFGLVGVTAVDGVMKYVAPLGGRSRLEAAEFLTWWRRSIFENPGITFSREDLVLHLANQEGGAHFDARLREPYGGLARGNALGYTFGDSDGTERPAPSPVPANVRQIGWELQTTIEEQLPDLL